MIVQLTQLYKSGIKLTKEEREAAPLTGILSVSDWREGSAGGRAVRVASLERAGPDYANTRPSMVAPLFDPVLVRMNEHGMVLVGYQIGVIDQKPIHYMQQWWITFPDSE